MKLAPDEHVLTGAWLRTGTKVVADETAERIASLVARHLRKVAVDWSGWETLYVDPDDGRLWEHTYPQGEMHGGGPPQLRVIDPETARHKYGPISTP